jgi:hypothetical protein
MNCQTFTPDLTIRRNQIPEQRASRPVRVICGRRQIGKNFFDVDAALVGSDGRHGQNPCSETTLSKIHSAIQKSKAIARAVGKGEVVSSILTGSTSSISDKSLVLC